MDVVAAALILSVPFWIAAVALVSIADTASNSGKGKK
jgi:hypothetical protein